LSPPTWIPGQVLASADVNSWFVPLVGLKTSNQTTVSNTTLLNDTQVVFAAAANVTYWVETALIFESATGTDIKFQWNGPAGATLNGVTNYRTLASAATVHGQWQLGASGLVSSAGSGSGTPVGMTAFGTLATGGSSGNFQLQWAQSTSGGINTTVMAGCAVIAWRIA